MHDTDTYWSWVVTFSSCVGLMLTLALRSTSGIFYTYMMDEFNLEMTTLTLIGSTSTAISYVGAIIVVPLTERFGIRPVLIMGGLHLFLGCLLSSFVSSFLLLFTSMAIISGIGTAFSFVTFYLAVDMYCDKNKSIAMPLASVGASLSVTIFSPLSELLLKTYSFKGAMLIYAAIMLNIVVCGAVVFPIRPKDIHRENSSKESFSISFCKTPGFILYLIVNFLYTTAYFIPMGLLPETAVSKGVDLDEFALTFAFSGLTQIAGRLVFGFLCHRYPRHITRLWSVYLLMIAITMLIVPFSTETFHFLFFNLSSGFFLGGANLGYNLSLKNIVESKYFGRGMSLAFVMQGLGSLVGNPLAAFLQNITKDSGMPYYFGTGVFSVASLLLLPFSKARQQDTTEIEVEVTEKDVHSVLKYTKHMQENIHNRDIEL